MSSHQPVIVNLTLHEFVRHGAEISSFRDGWGISVYQASDAFVLKDARAGSASDCERWVEEHELPSRVVISHVRKASQGAVCFENTQPFSRELGGVCHTFAHNGDLRGFRERLSLGKFRPLGDTDSEHAFCSLLAQLESLWLGSSPPQVDDRIDVLSRIAASLRDLGTANFLYSDSDLLFAHGHRGRAHSDASDWSPGLYLLPAICSAGTDPTLVRGVDVTAPAEQPMTLVATVPLSDQTWRPMRRGELAWFRGGRLLGQMNEHEQAKHSQKPRHV